MRKLLARLMVCVFLVSLAFATTAQAPKPKRINRAIDLLSQGQPIYYTGSHSGTEGSFEQGKKDAQTYADYISYDMEHAPYDIKGLAEYMQGLAAGGPTKSGHRTPAVIVNVPVNGTDEAAVHANAWMFAQVLATGVHGIILTHADTAGAVRAFVEAIRLPIHKQAVGNGISEGRRGVHGADTAAKIWGISRDEYLQKADAWPLNPDGELLLGLKLEDKYALENAEQSCRSSSRRVLDFTLQVGQVSETIEVSGAAALIATEECNGRDRHREQRTPQHWFNTDAFVLQPFGTHGNVGRNTVITPGLLQWDFSVHKEFRIAEKHAVQFRFEAFNFPNHPNWGTPNRNLVSPTFSQISTTRTNMRELQVALKYMF